MPLNTQSDSDKFCSHVCDPENDNCPMKVSFVKRRERRALPVLPVMENSCCYLSDCLSFWSRRTRLCRENQGEVPKTATGALWFCFKIAQRWAASRNPAELQVQSMIWTQLYFYSSLTGLYWRNDGQVSNIYSSGTQERMSKFKLSLALKFFYFQRLNDVSVGRFLSKMYRRQRQQERVKKQYVVYF